MGCVICLFNNYVLVGLILTCSRAEVLRFAWEKLWCFESKSKLASEAIGENGHPKAKEISNLDWVLTYARPCFDTRKHRVVKLFDPK